MSLQQQPHNLHLTIPPKEQMNRQLPLIIPFGCSPPKSFEQSSNSFWGGLEDNRRMERQKSPPEGLGVIFFAGDPRGDFGRMGGRALDYDGPLFVLDGEVEFGWVDIVVAFRGCIS